MLDITFHSDKINCGKKKLKLFIMVYGLNLSHNKSSLLISYICLNAVFSEFSPIFLEKVKMFICGHKTPGVLISRH